MWMSPAHQASVLWVVRTGSPWRDLPGVFGKWNTVLKRYRDWVKANVFVSLFEACSDDRTWNTPWSMQQSSRFIATARAQKGDSESQAIGRSKGGLRPRFLHSPTLFGNLVRLVLLPGHRFDSIGVAPLIDGMSFDALIADTAFDSNAIIADLDERGAKIVIAQHHQIGVLRAAGRSIEAIARALGRAKATISRELLFRPPTDANRIAWQHSLRY
jgi:transposase